MAKRMKIGIAIYATCTASMVTGFYDILAMAGQLYKGDDEPLFDMELLGTDSRPVSSFSGIGFTPHQTLATANHYDLVYVPGFIGDASTVIAQQQALIAWLQQTAAGQQTVIAAACNGNMLLAAAGILNHKKATTHWSLADRMKKDYPAVDLQPDRILIDNGLIISAAGVTACCNLALHIVQRFANAALALQCAKVFLVDAGRKIQTPYQLYQFKKNHGDEAILQAQAWLENNYREPFSVQKLIDMVQLTPKTLTRRFKKATGETPQLYLQKIRIETAKRLLESKNMTFNEVTWEVGYNDVSAFHKTFKQETGLTPINYRQKFSML